MTNGAAESLTDQRGLGGIIALDGFDYQTWDLICRIPVWLANPVFESAIYEGLEDFEVRFFAPHAPKGSVLERYQAKQSVLTPAETKVVFGSFKSFDQNNPSIARLQCLVMPGLPPSLSWMTRHIDRVRNARPFYAPFASLLATSDEALRTRLEDEFPDGLGSFVAENVDLSLRSYINREQAFLAFQTALDAAFPSLEASSRSARVAFDALESLVRRSVGTAMGGGQLQRAMEQALGCPLGLPLSLPLLVRSDRSESDETKLEIDASVFSGGDYPYPEPPVWTSQLIAPLAATAGWLAKKNQFGIALSGNYRLSTATVLGWSFRSASGFDLEIPTKDGSWSTDDRPGTSDPTPQWIIQQATILHIDRLVVSIGVLRDPAPTLTGRLGIPEQAILSLHLANPLTSAKEAQASVTYIKRSIDLAIARLSPKEIDLFFVGPAALAVALGHRWNALPPTQLHEFSSRKGTYLPSALLS